MGNVPFHKSIIIRETVAAGGHTLLFLPPYSPFLNPIENLFNQWKTIVRLSSPKSEQELDKSMVDAKSKISVQNLKDYYKNSKKYYSRCLELEIIEN